MNNISFTREPAVWISIIMAGINIFILAGVVAMSAQLQGAILTFLNFIAGAVVIRSQVFAPKSKDGDKLVAVQYAGQKIESVK